VTRIIALFYGIFTYAIMFLTFLYLFAFLANFLVPKTVDSGEPGPWITALLMNIALILLFGLPHSVMARPAFKDWWTKFVPRSVERSTYVLVATGSTILLFWLWRPMTTVIWQVGSSAGQVLLWGLFVLGIFVLFASTFIIDHFDLFGLRQVFLNLRQKPYTHHSFSVTFFYKFVRHPLYVGWLLIFWSTPLMTLGHLVFALGMSAYILIAIRYEERDLEQFHGRAYTDYKAKVPMLVPHIGKTHETIKPSPAHPAG
jgi:protein-S-isoprenylcysteine O-methyltransferase Ste14